jgi:Bacterial aa3 type cytochrome c oxidase subunit IV
MALVDPDYDYARRRQGWLGFARLIRYALAVIVVILVGMAIFLT